MRTLYVLILMMAGTVVSLNGQHPQWTNYSHTKNTAQVVCLDSTLLWAGTSGGLVVTDIHTGQQIRYDKSNSGLPGLLITAAHRDATGVMWFGDFEYGLTSFDGVHWNNWNTTNSPLPNNSVYDISHDHDNRIWVATQGGLACFDGIQWSTITNYGSVQRVASGSDSSIWFGAQDHGLVRLKDGVYHIFHTNNTIIPSNYILDITPEGSEKLWIATTAGLVLLQDTAFSLFTTANSGLPHNMVRSMAVDASGKKWFGTQGGGLALYNDTTWQVFNQSNSPMPCNFVFSVATSSDGRCFVASCTQLGAFDGIHWVQYHTSNSGVPSGNIQAIAHDHQGVTWIGSTNGLVFFDGMSWNNGVLVPTNHINAIAVDSAGKVWIGTGLGLAVYDGGVWTNLNTATSGLLTDVISCIAFGPGNKVYVGGYGGVSVLDDTTWTTWTPLNTPLPDPSVMSLAVDHTGAVWIGTETGGIARITDTVWTLFPAPVFGTPGTEVRAILPDLTGGVWVASIGGLAHFNGTSWSVYTMSNSALPSQVVTALTRDSQNRIWAGTTAGLAMRDTTGTFTVFNAYNSGIPSNAVGALAFDATDRLWVGTYFAGVGVYDPQQTSAPFVFTIQALGTGLTTASVTGEITHDGGTPVTSRGFVYDTIPDPTLSQNSGGITTGSGIGTFSASLINLLPGTHYYLRSFAANSTGVSYGNTLTFNTQHIGIPMTEREPLLTIFPNPVVKHLQVNASEPIRRIRWIDLSGRMVKQNDLNGALSATLPVDGLHAGIYLMYIELDHGLMMREKVVVKAQ